MVVKYLSAAWFQRVSEDTAGSDASGAGGGLTPDGQPLVLRQVVTDTPDGDVRYDVVISDGRAVIDPSVSARADLTFTSDYATASAIAAGRLSTQAALAAGRLRVRGDVTVLAAQVGTVAALDPVPAWLRAATEY